MVKRFEFSEYGDVDPGAESVLELVQGGDLAMEQQLAQCIGSKGSGSHRADYKPLLF